MFTWLATSLDEDPSADLAGQFSRDDLSNKARGLTDSLDGRRRALAVTDITELLSISERQVYKLVAAHRIPCFKIGGSNPLRSVLPLRQKMSPGLGTG